MVNKMANSERLRMGNVDVQAGFCSNTKWKGMWLQNLTNSLLLNAK